MRHCARTVALAPILVAANEKSGIGHAIVIKICDKTERDITGANVWRPTYRLVRLSAPLLGILILSGAMSLADLGSVIFGPPLGVVEFFRLGT